MENASGLYIIFPGQPGSQADLSLHWAHRSFCWFCHVLAHMFLSVFSGASAKQQYAAKSKPIVPKMELPTAVNHLFLAKQGTHGKNRYVAAGPRIANMYPVTRPVPLEESPRTVRPITPHILGDTKCKWLQKQKKEPDGNAKTPVSPKKSALNDIKEVESNIDKGLNQESDEVKAVKEKNNNNSEVSSKQGFEKTMNDSGLGTSVHSSESSDFVGAYVTEANQGVNEGKIDIADDKSVLGNQKINSTQKPGAANGSENGILNESITMHNTENSQTEVTDIQEKSVDSSDENECFSHEINELSKTAHISESDSCVSADKHSSNLGDQGLDTLGESSDSGALNVSELKAVSHQLANGDVNRSHIDNSSKINQEVGAAASSMNINNNCVSVDEVGNVKPKIALASYLQVNSNTDKNQKQNSSKLQNANSVKEFRARAVSQPIEANSESVDMYYSNKKNLAGKSSSFDDHLQTYRRAKSFNPFPVKHVNTNRARTGVKLGLYKQSTLDEFERNLRKPVWGK